jgi:hypothetical protein
MAAVPKSYKKNVAEGNGMLIFSIVFVIIIRLVYFLYFDFTHRSNPVNGYLWKPLSSIFSDSLISLLCSSLVAVSMAVLATHINTTYLFIRRKTILLPAVIVLLFSCHPQFMLMSAEYISTMLFLVIIFILFSAYNSPGKQMFSFKASFILALGSLFTPALLVYLPVLWLALAIMRCFNFKSLLASLLGVFILYFPAFSYYFLTDSLDIFLVPFTSVNVQQLTDFPFYQLNIGGWIILGFSTILLSILVSDNYIDRHKDKIRTRAYLSLLSFIAVLSILAYLFLDIDFVVYLFIALLTGAFLLSHFFALVEKRGGVILFYFSMIFYILVCIFPFLSL